MGMSCTRDQSTTMERIFAGERQQEGWSEGRVGLLFTVGPAGNRDYGYPGCMTMGIWVYQVLPDQTSERVGKIVIDADGKILRIPREARDAFRIYY